MSDKKIFGVNFADDVKINKFRLEDECEIQSEMYYHYGRLLAEKKNHRDHVRAKTELLIREKPDTFLPVGVKLTEGAVDAVIKSDEELTRLDKEVRLLEAAVGALEDRRSQLKNLTELYLAGYYSAPDGKRPDANAEAAREQRSALNRKEKANE